MFLQCERWGSQELGGNRELGYLTAWTHPRVKGALVETLCSRLRDAAFVLFGFFKLGLVPGWMLGCLWEGRDEDFFQAAVIALLARGYPVPTTAAWWQGNKSLQCLRGEVAAHRWLEQSSVEHLTP